jgi:hypothetical protein
MVDAELQLEALPGARQRRTHYAGIVDERVDTRLLRGPFGCGAHAGEIRLVERQECHVGARRRPPDPAHGGLCLRLVAAGEQYPRAARRQHARCFKADTRVGAGDDEALARLIGDVGFRESAHRASPFDDRLSRRQDDG